MLCRVQDYLMLEHEAIILFLNGQIVNILLVFDSSAPYMNVLSMSYDAQLIIYSSLFPELNTT